MEFDRCEKFKYSNYCLNGFEYLKIFIGEELNRITNQSSNSVLLSFRWYTLLDDGALVCDLHGLTIEEAKASIGIVLNDSGFYPKHKPMASSRSRPNATSWIFVTGVGNHPKGGKAILRPAGRNIHHCLTEANTQRTNRWWCGCDFCISFILCTCSETSYHRKSGPEHSRDYTGGCSGYQMKCCTRSLTHENLRVRKNSTSVYTGLVEASQDNRKLFYYSV